MDNTKHIEELKIFDNLAIQMMYEFDNNMGGIAEL